METSLTERAAYSVPAFCMAHGFSRALLYKALREGWGPKIMKCGARTLITVEAAARWRAKMEKLGKPPAPAEAAVQAGAG